MVERILGSGGMGLVVKATHEQLAEPVAIKLLHPKAAGDRVQVERFLREARATVRIKSEHVVRVLDAGTQTGTDAPFLVMEYLVGQDLGQLVKQNGPLPFTVAVDYVLQACEALAAAHAQGIVHRDLKPSNFFLTRGCDGEPLVKVLDFGISKFRADGELIDPKLTETQAVFGSPTYMSPEQIRSAKHVDQRSDVWSIGVSLFELLTGRLPFVADNVAGLLASIIADQPYQLRAFNPSVPPELESVVYRCLEKRPEARLSSVTDLALLLRPFAPHHCQTTIERIERIGRGLATNPSMLPSLVPQMPTRVTPSVPPAAVTFGTTETDLSAATPAAEQRARRRSLVFAVVGVVAGLLIAGGAWAVRRDPSPALQPSLPPPVVTVIANPTLTPSASATPAPTLSGSQTANQPNQEPPVEIAGTTAASGPRTPTRERKAVRQLRGHGRSTPPPPPPPAVTSTRPVPTTTTPSNPFDGRL